MEHCFVTTASAPVGSPFQVAERGKSLDICPICPDLVRSTESTIDFNRMWCECFGCSPCPTPPWYFTLLNAFDSGHFSSSRQGMPDRNVSIGYDPAVAPLHISPRRSVDSAPQNSRTTMEVVRQRPLP